MEGRVGREGERQHRVLVPPEAASARVGRRCRRGFHRRGRPLARKRRKEVWGHRKRGEERSGRDGDDDWDKEKCNQGN